MTNDKKKSSIDLNLKVDGLKEVGEKSAELVAENVTAARRLMASICMPVAEELGLYFKDKVYGWRLNNFINLSRKVETKQEHLKVPKSAQVHPRILLGITDKASVQDNDDLQNWWAGLIVASMGLEPNDDNISFVNMMDRITVLQSKIFELACRMVKIARSKDGLIRCEPVFVSLQELENATGCTDIMKLDRETDLLNQHGLFDAGFQTTREGLKIELTPTLFGIEFFAKCNGYTGDLFLFYEQSVLNPCEGCGGFHMPHDKGGFTLNA